MPAKKQELTILAMDLSLNGSAFAVLEPFAKTAKIKEMRFVDNTVKEMKNATHGEKLSNIYFNLNDILEKHKPTDLVREKGFCQFNKATQAIFKVVGVVDFTLYCNDCKLNIDEIAPTSVKLAIAGHGKASKDEVEAGLRQYLVPSQQNVLFDNDNLSDAVAVGIAYCFKKKLLIV